ncbi:MAG TPA: alcohol dehydrogenase catalytic domain-containing protein [Steroidobacteraceae bacterium]|jgi:D-arabinose 1-dehydrogenase-like Zn-dependent alcohol dehydrogenase|nr:alcohol dehydrogenase catalytic domain-containing protein [Steroidobacteraceae bacterium]
MTLPVPETSVVIRAFNEERWLPELFESLHRQQYRDFESLVVDSGSVDRTRDIASANGARIVRLRSEDFTFGYSLNIGIEAARGSFIVIISAHAIPTDEHWLSRLIAPLRRAGIAMVFGGQRGHAVSKFSEARDFERVFHSKPMSMDDDHVFVNNANSAIRKDLWEQHRFDEGLPGLEDAEWAKYWIPRGLEIFYEPRACVYHVHTESWAQVRHRFHREGIAGRWTAVRIIRHIPREVARELWWGMKDIGLALRQGSYARLAGEILRYRYNKTLGIVKGIWDSRTITNPSKRAKLHFDKGFSAVVIQNAHSAVIEPRSIPSLKPGEILVRVAYAGICRSDVELLDGRAGGHKSAGMFPVVPGREFSGTIVTLGDKVTSLKEGDRVVVLPVQGCGTCAACTQDGAAYCQDRRELGSFGVDGGFAEYCVTRARYALEVPEGLTLREAALTQPAAVVIKGLRRLGADLSVGGLRRCAIVGADAVGHLAAKILQLRGYDVVVFGAEAAQLDCLRGAVETRRELDGFDSFDLIVEASGDQRVLTTALRQSRPGATLLLLNSSYGHQTISVEQVVAYDKSIVGAVGCGRDDFAEALATLQSLDLRPLLQSVFPMEDFENAWSAFRANSSPKVMLNADSGAV